MVESSPPALAADENQAAAVNFSVAKVQLLIGSQKADEAVAFYKEAFGAEEVKRSTYPKRKADQELPLLSSAEIKIGPSVLVISDHAEVEKAGSGITFRLETDDVKTAVSNAVKSGATQDGEINEDEDGGIFAKLKDPFGFMWIIGSAAKNNCPDT